ncbi:MAG: hypothetical protein ABW252_21660 [Polyangiales bacterium]
MSLRLVCILIFLFAASAQADAPARTALHWTRGEGAERCIDGRALARRVEELTGPLFVAPAEAERGLEGSVARTRRGFSARIVNVSPSGGLSGERVLTTEQRDCRALDAALVFVVALTLDPELARTASPELLAAFASETPPDAALLAELEATPPAPVILPAPPEPEPPPPPAPPLPPAPEPPKKAPTPIRLMLGAAWLGRTLRGWPLGPEAKAQVDFPQLWPLALTLRAFPTETTVTSDAGRARFRAYALAVATCPLTLTRGRTRVQGCAGAELTHLRGRGIDFARNRKGGTWEPALVAEAQLHVALVGGLGLYGAASVGVRLTRQRFAIDDGAERRNLLTPSRVGVTLSAGASYAF